MPDSAGAFQSFQFLLPEYLRHEPHIAMQLKVATRPVAGDNSSAFLATMLQREQAVVGQDRGIRVTEYTENPAFVLRQGIPIGQLLVRGSLRGHGKRTSSTLGLYSMFAIQLTIASFEAKKRRSSGPRNL